MNKNIKEFSDSLVALDAKIRDGQSRIRCLRLKWDSVAEVRKSLRAQLGLRRYFLELRKLVCDATSSAISVHSNSYVSNEAPSTYVLRRKSGGGWGRRSRYSQGEGDCRAVELACHKIPDADQEKLARKLLTRFRKLCETADLLYSQCKERQSTRESKPLDLPAYLEIKKFMPIGGRVAYSVLIACSTGKLDDNLAGQHCLLGWYIEGGNRTLENLTRCIRGVTRGTERGGKAPSCKAGREYLTKWIRERETLTKARRCQTLRDNAYAEISGGVIGQRRMLYTSPYMLRYLRQNLHAAKIRAKVAAKIMGTDDCQNYIATIITSPIERIGESDVYRANCIASNNGENHRTGIVLFRANWPDLLHLHPTDEVTPDILTEIKERGADAYHIRRAIEASDYLFQQRERRRKQEAERALNEKEREARRRRELAAQVRTLRRLPIVTLKDSTSRGNCVPGTLQWCEQLGLAPNQRDAAPGREIARKWALARYPQPDRLGNVLRMVEQHAGSN